MHTLHLHNNKNSKAVEKCILEKKSFPPLSLKLDPWLVFFDGACLLTVDGRDVACFLNYFIFYTYADQNKSGTLLLIQIQKMKMKKKRVNHDLEHAGIDNMA